MMHYPTINFNKQIHSSLTNLLKCKFTSANLRTKNKFCALYSIEI